MDACYFFGYAFASYAAVPFVLPGLRFLRPVSGRWRGESLTGVRVEYPAAPRCIRASRTTCSTATAC